MTFTEIISLIVMCLCIANAYFSWKNWYAQVYLMVLRQGRSDATAFLVEKMGYSQRKAERNVAAAIHHYG